MTCEPVKFTFRRGSNTSLGIKTKNSRNDLHELEIRLHPEDRERVTQSLRTYLA